MCYAKETNPNLMVWWGGGRWWLGKRDEVGQNRGWIKVVGEEMTPPEKGWVVYSAKLGQELEGGDERICS